MEIEDIIEAGTQGTSPETDYSDPFRPPKRPAHERKGFKVAEIQAIHHQIKRFILAGMSNVDIARALNVSPQMVSATKNSPVIKEQLEIMQGAADAEAVDIQTRIKELSPVALANLQEVVVHGTLHGENVPDTLIAKESNTVLDRYLGKPTQNIHSSGVHAHLTADDIAQMRQRALEAAGEPVPEAEVVNE